MARTLNQWNRVLLTIVFIHSIALLQTNAQSITKKDTINPKYKWDLNHIYKNDELWKKDYNWVAAKLQEYQVYQTSFTNSPELLLACLKFDEQIEQKMGLLRLYAKLKRDLNINDNANIERWSKILSLEESINKAKSFIRPGILELSEEQLNDYLAQYSDLKIYEHFFTSIQKSKKHILTKEKEDLLAMGAQVSRFPSEMFFTLETEQDIPEVTDDMGNRIKISGMNWEASKTAADRNYREQAYKAFFTPYIAHQNTYAALLNGRMQSKIYMARAHNYQTAMHASLSPNNIPVSVYTNLVKSVNQNLEPLHRWLSIKKNTMNLENFYDYDSYVSIFPDINEKYTFDEAVQIVLEALKPLGKQYINDLSKAFNSNWVDVYYTEGKAIGMYSSGVTPGTHPYVLLNWKGTVTDLFTLAHEMGHCMHAYYTGVSQPQIYAGYSYFVAEIASTTNEALLVDYLINNASSKRQKAMQIEKYLNNTRLMLYWTTMLAEFEKTIYESAENGEKASSKDFCEIIQTLTQKYNGPDIEIIDEQNFIWGPLRHLYIVDFYLYQYAVGYAASQQIASTILQNPENATKYVSFLKSGNSMYPIDAIKTIGVDMNSNKPVLQVAKKMTQMLDEFEKLTNN